MQIFHYVIYLGNVPMTMFVIGALEYINYIYYIQNTEKYKYYEITKYFYFSVFWIQQIWSKPVIICISIRKHILPSLCKCPSQVPDESSGIKYRVKQCYIDDAYILPFYIIYMKPRSPIIYTLYIYIYIYRWRERARGKFDQFSLFGAGTRVMLFKIYML